MNIEFEKVVTVGESSEVRRVGVSGVSDAYLFNLDVDRFFQDDEKEDK